MKNYLNKKIFGVKVQGWITVSIVLLVASMVGVVPNAIVVPVTKSSNWVMFYADDMDRWQLNSGVAKNDFQNQGWNVINTVGVGDRSNAQAGWNKFKSDYGTNPALCLMSTDQTPTYSDGPYYWGGFIIKNVETTGMVYTASYDKHLADFWIVGNAKKYHASDYVFVKFLTSQGRTVVIVWTGIRFDTGQLQGYVLAWRWVAVYGGFHEKNWYILDQIGNIVDSEIIAGENVEGDNPEENPLLNEDYTNPNESIPNVGVENPAVVAARERQAIMVMIGLIAVLLALGGFTLYLGKKMKLF